MPIHKIQRKLRANKPKLICSVLHCAVWEIIVWKAFNCNTLLTFSALQKVKLNAMLLLYCLWCQYYACWTNKHNLKKIAAVYYTILKLHFLEYSPTKISINKTLILGIAINNVALCQIATSYWFDCFLFLTFVCYQIYSVYFICLHKHFLLSYRVQKFICFCCILRYICRIAAQPIDRQRYIPCSDDKPPYKNDAADQTADNEV